ncbi:tetratricopeptide repeat protein [Candidatus Thiosymbion oneisti]|uniref:tetratricopeptide repeat protein n=1 Tax=Candidatus Thiosymbion oneisti TaxID=589554 RepID=UPI00159F2E91|nr:DUF1702 family protein [Candidatus Thiosymbion oneisti]
MFPGIGKGPETRRGRWPDYFEKNDTSISYFERAIELQEERAIKPSDILAYVRLGDALAKAGNIEQARDAWQRGVARLGSHGDLVERLEIDPAHLKESVTEAYNPWYGLAPAVNPVRVRNKLGELDLRGQFYAYEGMGFAVALFKDAVATQAAELVTRLPFASGSTFAHGAGRALWIKHGDDAAQVSRVVSAFPEQFQGDVRAGFGMGVAFARIDKLDVILSQMPPFRRESPMTCLDYLTGAAMGLAIRYETDPGYVRDAMKWGKSPRIRVLAPTLLQAGWTGSRPSSRWVPRCTGTGALRSASNSAMALGPRSPRKLVMRALPCGYGRAMGIVRPPLLILQQPFLRGDAGVSARDPDRAKRVRRGALGCVRPAPRGYGPGKVALVCGLPRSAARVDRPYARGCR